VTLSRGFPPVSRFRRFFPSLSVALTLGSALSGCMVIRDSYDVPPVDLPEQFQGSPALKGTLGDLSDQGDQATPASSAAPAAYSVPLGTALPTWWHLLGSEELNRLVDRALTRNPDLRMASLRVSQAEARYEQAFATRLPTLSTTVSSRADAPKDGTGSVSPGVDITSERAFSAGLQASYRVDLWGERKATAEAARFRVWQAVLARDDTQKTTVADLVGSYVDYLSFQDRLRVARETKDILSEMLKAVEERMERGDATILDISQQRAAVRSVEATIPSLEFQAAQAAHRIAQLCGTTPSQLQLGSAGLDSLTLPMVLPGVPSALLLRRSDVRAAEANLLAADADIDVARARVLPTLDLSAEIGQASTHMISWLQPENRMWNLVSSLSATIFDHGAREQAVEQTRARHEELTEGYISVIYTAVRESEDALSRLSFGTRRQTLQQAAVDASQDAVDQSRDSYRYGATDYLTLLDTERTLHNNRDQLYQVIRDRYRGAVDVFSSLGGGVELSDRLPGEGKRPDDLLSSKDAGTIALPEAPAEQPRPAADLADLQPAALGTGGQATPAPVDGGWRVVLPAVYSRSALDVAWRDLQAQFGDRLNGLRLYALALQDTDTPQGDGSADLARRWFRLSLGPFADKSTAQTMCSSLSRDGLRCSVSDVQ